MNLKRSIKGRGIYWLPSLLVFMIVYGQNPPWPLWTSGYLLTGIGALCLFIYTCLQPKKKSNVEVAAIAVSAFLLFYFFLIHGLAGGFRWSSIVFSVTAYCMILLRKSNGAIAFQFLTFTLAFLLAISITYYLLWLGGANLPSSPLDSGEWKGDNGYIDYANHYLFVQDSSSIIPRFYSVFDEPGVLGTLGAIILCGLRFNFRSFVVWIIFVAGLLTASIAFFVISFFGILFFNKNRNIKLTLVFLTIFIFGLIGFLRLSSFDEGSTSLFQYVLFRLSNVAQGEADYRSSFYLDKVYEEFIFSAESIFGKGTYFLSQNPELLVGQTPKFFILEYGFMGLISTALPYILIILLNREIRRDAWMLFGILCISFLQRPQLFTPSLLVLFAIICSYWSFQHRVEKVLR